MRLRWSRSSVSLAAALLLLSGAPLVSAGEHASSAASAAPDDTGKNVRDRDENAVTADQQSNDPQDVEITRKIRRSITKDKSFSTNARNVKIVTIDRNVTLRGPVDSAKEKERIAATAKKIAGADKVDDQIEIAK